VEGVPLVVIAALAAGGVVAVLARVRRDRP
jgi:hypothetical protein